MLWPICKVSSTYRTSKFVRWPTVVENTPNIKLQSKQPAFAYYLTARYSVYNTKQSAHDYIAGLRYQTWTEKETYAQQFPKH